MTKGRCQKIEFGSGKAEKSILLSVKAICRKQRIEDFGILLYAQALCPFCP
jgi:hypothetical protein